MSKETKTEARTMTREMKPETVARLAKERKLEQARSWSDLIARLRAKYKAEPNRKYAELMWGSLLKELLKKA